MIATKRTPALAPGYTSSATDHAEVAGAAARLFSGPAAAGAFVERESDLAAALTSRIQPDMAVSSGASDLGVVHRQTPEADLYFVANTSNAPVAASATFRVDASRAEAWDAMTGRGARRAGAAAPRRTRGPPSRSTSRPTNRPSSCSDGR